MNHRHHRHHDDSIALGLGLGTLFLALVFWLYENQDIVGGALRS